MLEASWLGPGGVHSVANQHQGDGVGGHQEVDSGEGV